jgi:hypothetical protein
MKVAAKPLKEVTVLARSEVEVPAKLGVALKRLRTEQPNVSFFGAVVSLKFEQIGEATVKAAKARL